MAASKPASGSGGTNPWLIAIVVSMATFMEVLDTSIANVSLRYIAGSLATSIDESTWVLTSYLVSNAIILPLSGWLAVRVGRKRFYMACVALFSISSFLCGIAPSLGFLLLARVLQGAGGGGLAPSEQAILTDTFPARQRGSAFALYGVAVVVAPAIGPTLGGWITDNYSWRWIFFINIPVGILSLTLTHFLIPPDKKVKLKDHKAEARIDYLGFGLVALGLGCLQVVLDRGQIDDWFGSPLITIFSIISATSLVVLVIHELTTPDPVVDLPLMAEPKFFVSCFCMLLFGGVLFSTTQLLPQLSQELLGYTATLAGETLSPGAFVIILLLPLAGWLLKHIQPKYLIAFGFLATSFSLWAMSHIFTLQTSFNWLTLGRCMQAFGLAFVFVPINTAAYSGLPPGKSNEASALINVMRNLGGSLGISVAQTMIDRRSQFHQERLAGSITPLNPRVFNAMHGWNPQQTTVGPPNISSAHSTLSALYTQVQNQASMMSYLDVFHVMAIAALVSVVIVLFMKKIDLGQGAQGH